jgi:MFS transporter, DHA2 family, multidrug resistance protein
MGGRRDARRGPPHQRWTLDALAQQLQSHGSDAKAMALKQLMQMTHTQGLVMAFADVFFLLTLLFVALAGLAVIIKRPLDLAPLDA